MPFKIRTVAIAVSTLVVLAIVWVVALTSVSTASDQVALHYEGGPLSSKKFGNCVATSEKDYNGPGDTYYFYPTSQRYVDATGGERSDFGAITVVSKDNVELSVPITISFNLITDCTTLRSFHEKVGNRFKAYMDGDSLSPGWKDMLDYAIRQPLDQSLDRIAQNYVWRDLYNNPDVKAEVEKAVNENIDALVKSRVQGATYFNGWNALVQKPTPTNKDLVQAIAAEQNNVAQSNAAKAKAEADKAVAEAQVAVAEAEGRKRQAEIAGYGSVDEYNKAQAIAKGINPYQPTYGSSAVVAPR